MGPVKGNLREAHNIGSEDDDRIFGGLDNKWFIAVNEEEWWQWL